MPDPPDDRSIEQPVSTSFAESIPVSIQRSEIADLPMAEAQVPDSETIQPTAVRVCLNRVVREELPSEVPPKSSDNHSPVPRAHATRRPLIEVLAEPIEQDPSDASLPSPGSQASSGANSVPAVVHNPAPQYPPDALKARQTGRVVLRVKIAADGSVVAASIHRSSGVRSLDRAALETVQRWRFAPAQSSSLPIRQIAVPIRFLIDDAETNGH
jgi:protein TonB